MPARGHAETVWLHFIPSLPVQICFVGLILKNFPFFLSFKISGFLLFVFFVGLFVSCLFFLFNPCFFFQMKTIQFQARFITAMHKRPSPCCTPPFHLLTCCTLLPPHLTQEDALASFRIQKERISSGCSGSFQLALSSLGLFVHGCFRGRLETLFYLILSLQHGPLKLFSSGAHPDQISSTKLAPSFIHCCPANSRNITYSQKQVSPEAAMETHLLSSCSGPYQGSSLQDE